MRRLIVAVAIAAGVSFAAQAGEAMPAKAAGAFYKLYIKEKPRSLPDAALRAKLKPIVSTSLHGLLADAAAAEDAHRKKSNNEEPPLFEGDLFTSLYEGATSYKIGTCVKESDKAYCDVALSYAEAGDAKPTTWTDKAVLVRGPRGWLLDDIAFGGTWDFGQHGTLRGTLRQVASYSGE